MEIFYDAKLCSVAQEHVEVLHGTLHASAYLVELEILVTCRRLIHNQPGRRFSCFRTSYVGLSASQGEIKPDWHARLPESVSVVHQIIEDFASVTLGTQHQADVGIEYPA